MQFKKEARFIISDFEMINEPIYLNLNNTVLYVLQKKGAPVEGKILLKFKDGYRINKYYNPLTRATTFDFIAL